MQPAYELCRLAARASITKSAEVLFVDELAQSLCRKFFVHCSLPTLLVRFDAEVGFLPLLHSWISVNFDVDFASENLVWGENGTFCRVV